MLSKDIFLLKIGKRIKRIRKSKGLTQEELAEITGLDRTSISKIESGNQQTELYHIYKIAIALEIHIKELFDYD